MDFERPLDWITLAKMFIKVLYEHKSEKGRFTHHGWDLTVIFDKTLPEYFEISALDDDEQIEGRRAVKFLEGNGYIVGDPTQREGEFKTLTAKGRKLAEKEFTEMEFD